MELSNIPLLIKAVTVIIERSLKDNLSVFDHISPNNTSTFNSANFGAISPKEFLPAVYFVL